MVYLEPFYFGYRYYLSGPEEPSPASKVWKRESFIPLRKLSVVYSQEFGRQLFTKKKQSPALKHNYFICNCASCHKKPVANHVRWLPSLEHTQEMRNGGNSSGIILIFFMYMFASFQHMCWTTLRHANHWRLLCQIHSRLNFFTFWKSRNSLCNSMPLHFILFVSKPFKKFRYV